MTLNKIVFSYLHNALNRITNYVNCSIKRNVKPEEKNHGKSKEELLLQNIISFGSTCSPAMIHPKHFPMRCLRFLWIL